MFRIHSKLPFIRVLVFRVQGSVEPLAAEFKG